VGGGVLVGWAAVGALAAMLITVWVILLSSQGFGFSQSCVVYPSGQRVCSPLNPWVWAMPCTGIVGAAVGATGSLLFRRVRIRLTRTPTIFD